MRQTLHHLHHHNSTLLVKQAKTSLPLTATTGVTGNTADLTVSVCVSVPAAVSGAGGGGLIQLLSEQTHNQKMISRWNIAPPAGHIYISTTMWASQECQMNLHNQA